MSILTLSIPTLWHRLVLCLSCFVALPIFADTLAVPSDFPTIQEAIDAAEDADTVLVSPGGYFESIDFLGKEISVISTSGPAVTIIDGSDLDVVVRLVNGEGPGALLEGFTIRNGRIASFDPEDGGAGIQIIGSSPTVRGNIIRDNIASFSGAGVYCSDSNAFIIDNEFRDNFFESSILDASIGCGGGLLINGGAVTVIRNLFTGNIASSCGGGILCFDTQGTSLENNELVDNIGGWGGGIAIIENCIVETSNTLVAGNVAIGHISLSGISQGLGGGIYIAESSTASFLNATIVDNEAVVGDDGDGIGGGIFGDTAVAVLPYFESCIVRDNIAGTAPQATAMLTVAYSNFAGGFPGQDNFDADPLFVDGPLGPFYLSQVAAGQAADSPCLDAGNPMGAIPDDTTTRTDHEPDVGVVDVGFHYPLPLADEFRRGDADASGIFSGLADAIYILDFQFLGGPSPPCDDAADFDDDGILNGLVDGLAMLAFQFTGGPPPAPPGLSCGVDPTLDGLNCVSYVHCP